MWTKCLAALFVFIAFPLVADDIITIDGKTYKDVMLLKSGTDAIGIGIEYGGSFVATIPFSKMTDADKVKYGYNPVKEKAAIEKQKAEEEVARQKRLKVEATRQASLKAEHEKKVAEQKRTEEEVRSVAERQAHERTVWEQQARAEQEKSLRQQRKFQGLVLQVLSDSLLLVNAFEAGGKPVGLAAGNLYITGETCALEIDTRSFVDDSAVTVEAVESGTYSYVSVLGVSKKIRKFKVVGP